MKQRKTLDEPITPAVDGQPPTWVVACLDCGFSEDAHGTTAEDAILAVARRHESTPHRLIARAVDYSGHPLYAEPLSG